VEKEKSNVKKVKSKAVKTVQDLDAVEEEKSNMKGVRRYFDPGEPAHPAPCQK
jgi:hypothetical protein